jgi:probable addiction module antidote protein
MAKITTTRWDTAEFLRTEADIAGYLEAVVQENDTALLVHALGVAARARGMTRMARETGITRESLYRALSGDGNPEFATVMKVVRALGLRLQFKRTKLPRKPPRKPAAGTRRDPVLDPV